MTKNEEKLLLALESLRTESIRFFQGYEQTSDLFAKASIDAQNIINEVKADDFNSKGMTPKVSYDSQR